MIIRPFTPHPALRPYIIAYAFLEVDELIDAQNPIHIFPVDYTVMCFALDEKKTIRELHSTQTINYPLCYVGFLSKLRSLDTFVKRVVQVHFKPFGAYKLLGIPQHNFTDLPTDMESVFPKLRSMVNSMQDQIQSPENVIAVLENWLLQRLQLSGKICTARMEHACNIIRAHDGNININELCRQVAMSPTALRDHFKEKIGISPKTLSRLVRFNELNRLVCKNKNVSWKELSNQFHFFDQSHFIKEFKHFFGCTPSQLHKKGTLSFTGKLIDDQELFH